MEKRFQIVLAGNPNCGKSTIFNNLTGAHQHVANYPGVTVEKREGHREFMGHEFNFIDLPGTYSLNARSEEELIARKYLVEERPDIVINVVDALHMERNLYLSLQIKELGLKQVIAMNMSDSAESKGVVIDIERLSVLLGIPIVKTVGNKKEGMEKLLATCHDFAEGKIPIDERGINYGERLEEEIEKISSSIGDSSILLKNYSKRWLAIKLLENDDEVVSLLKNDSSTPEGLFGRVEESSLRIKKLVGDEAEIALIDRRYGIISGACTEALKFTAGARHDWSDLLDSVLTHKFFGIPIFMGVMWALFTLTFKVGEPLVGFVERFFDLLNTQAKLIIPPGMLQSAVADGAISGVGGVLSFLPNIMILYLFIALLEDSGYMSRAAFMMDNLMHKVGLHGKSFIPLLIGFGCSVPAVMSTRMLESKKDRIITMLIVPLMSCSARLTVYTLIIGAFFRPSIAGHILFSIYLIGLLMAMVVAKLFDRFLFKGESVPFVMELPPYMVPTFHGIAAHTWRRSWLYVKKAGTVILGISLIVWGLSNFPSQSADKKERLEKSFAGYIGKGVTPFLEPIGLGDWKISVSLLSGLAAKEVVVSTLGTLYSMDDRDDQSSALRKALANDPFFSPLVAYLLMVFVLLSSPCLSTFAVIKQESHGWRWPIFMITYTTVLAWLVCFIIFRLASLFGVGA